MQEKNLGLQIKDYSKITFKELLNRKITEFNINSELKAIKSK